MVLSNLTAVFRITDLRRRFLYVLGMLVIVRLGAHIPIAGIDMVAVRQMFQDGDGGLFTLANIMSGGALSNFSIFALGILPYINASIIMQLLMVAVPQLKEMVEEGESGRKKYAQYTRYLTVVLAIVQSIGWIFGPLRDKVLGGMPFPLFFISATVFLVGGSILVMWIGELITEYGIGNGASIIIFTGIVSRLFSYIAETYQVVSGGIVSPFNVVIMVGVLLAVIVFIVIVQEAERKIPVQYAKRIVGRKMYGGQSTYIPLKINQGGVLPIIFATTVLSFLLTVVNLFSGNGGFMQTIADSLRDGSIYIISLFLLIFFFTFFYTAIMFNPVELANNIKKYGGFILGVRPGQPTAKYLERIISRLTLVGALFLALVAIVPMVTANITKLQAFAGIGGTSLLIMVGVALDLMRQTETHLVNRQYEGLLD